MHKNLVLLLLLFLVASCSSAKIDRIDDYVFKTKSAKKEYLKAYNKSLTLWKIPYQEEDIVTSYGIAHVIISGPKNAEPLILLHGMDASSTMWFPNIEAFSKNYRVYAIDFLMEAGKSVSCGETLSRDEIIAWYTEIFKHYNLQDLKIVGASRGGWIGTLLAIQEKNTIKKLALLSPAQTFETIDNKRKASSALMLKLFPSKRKLKRTLDAFSFYPKRIDSIYKKQFYLANLHSKSNSSFLQMTPFSKKEFDKIKIPVLLLVGDHDVINSKESIEKAKKWIENSQTDTISNAGHFLTIDQAEIVNKKIIEFLRD